MERTQRQTCSRTYMLDQRWSTFFATKSNGILVKTDTATNEINICSAGSLCSIIKFLNGKELWILYLSWSIELCMLLDINFPIAYVGAPMLETIGLRELVSFVYFG